MKSIMSAITEFIHDNRLIIELWLCLAYRDKVETAYSLGLYKNKVNYYIDKN